MARAQSALRVRLDSPRARQQQLRLFLVIMGGFLLFALPFVTYAWPAGWRWKPHSAEYEQMLIAIYMTFGAFLLYASRNPARFRSLIWFAVWSGIVHSGVMAYHASMAPAERGHFFGDVPFGFVSAVILGVLARRALRGARTAG